LALTTALVDRLATERERLVPMSESAFLAFYARTAGPLAGYLRRLSGNHAVAEDLLQDTYVRFLVSTRVPEDDEHRKNYLFRIATNLARDHFRRTARQRPLAAPDNLMSGDPPPADGDVWARLALLSPRDRELLLLAYVEGLTHKEIADITGLMRASIRPLLFRARRRFAAVLRAAGLADADVADREPSSTGGSS
jgi:RNA polymerase sigma-70 factor (ECF subfamily)